VNSSSLCREDAVVQNQCRMEMNGAVGYTWSMLNMSMKLMCGCAVDACVCHC